MKAERIPAPVLPRRRPDAHKGDSGRLLCVAGAVGSSGAARLAARGALASGVGILTVAVPEPVRAEVAREDPAFLTAGLPSTLAGTFAFPAARDLLARSETAHAVAIGPGITTNEETMACAVKVLAGLRVPAVVDADALNAVAISGVPPTSGPCVWTPHPAEAARLLRADLRDVRRDREAAVRDLWARLGGVVVLKGAGTLVTDGDVLLVNPTGNAGLATGGAGDVLTGIIGAFLAARLSLIEAAAAAVYIHGQAADELRQATGERGLTMRALLDALPATLARHESLA